MKDRVIVYNQNELEKEGLRTTNLLDGVLEKSRTILVFLCVYSTAWCLLTGMDLEIYRDVWIIVVINVIILVYILYLLRIKFAWTSWVSIPLFLLSYALVFYYYSKDVLQGFYYVAKKFVQLVRSYYKVSLLEPMSYIDDLDMLREESYYVTFFIVMVSILIAVIISMVYYRGMRSWLYLMYTSPFVILPLALGKMPDKFPFILYIAVTIIVLGSVRGQKRLRDAHIQSRVMIVMAIYCVIIVSLVHIAYPEAVYSETMDLRQTRKDFQNKVKEVSNIKLFSGMTAQQWMDYNFSKGIHYGRLGSSDEVKYDNKTVLKVRTNSHNIRDKKKNNLYLKGYVGDLYKGNRWEAYLENVPEYVEEWNELEAGGVTMEDVNRQFVRYLDSVSGRNHLSNYYFQYRISDAMEWEKIHIKNVAAGKGRMFVPYFSENPYSIKEKGRIGMDGEEGEYEVSYCPDMVQLMKKLLSDMGEGWEANMFIGQLDSAYENIMDRDKDLIKNIKSVNQFVEKYYLTVPENVQTIEINNVMGKLVNALEIDVYEMYRKYYIGKHGVEPTETFVVEEYMEDGELKKAFLSNMDSWDEDMKGFVKEVSKAYMGEIIKMVQRYMWDQTEYTLSPGRTPADKEFVDYFMFENKKGYCVHYATTATLLFRTLGIPSRMVEGYVVSPDSVARAKTDAYVKNETDLFTVNVKDSSAHAWVEIYIENVGWIPIEVTPGSGYNAGSEEPEVPVPSVSAAPIENPAKEEPNQRPEPTPDHSEHKRLVLRYSGKYGGWMQILDACSDKLAMPGVSFAVMILALIYGVATILSIRKRIYQVYRFKVLPKKSAGKRVDYLYQRMAKAFHHYGVVYDRQSVELYSEELREKFEFLGLLDAKSAFLDVVFKNKYSNQSISEEEYGEVREFYEIFCGRLYEITKPYNRWYMENILCLY